jgi:hypothetical protein
MSVRRGALVDLVRPQVERNNLILDIEENSYGNGSWWEGWSKL